MAIAKKRKKFFDVNIPLIKKETQAQAYEIEELDGKIMNYDVTRILRGKSALLQLIIKTENKEAVAKPRQLVVLPCYIRRMIRKGTNYVEDSFSTKSKDDSVRIKPFLITRRKVSRAVRKALRNKAKEFLIEYAKEKTSEELFDEIMRNIIQKNLSITLKKIYPLSLCEIRVLKVESPSSQGSKPEAGLTTDKQ